MGRVDANRQLLGLRHWSAAMFRFVPCCTVLIGSLGPCACVTLQAGQAVRQQRLTAAAPTAPVMSRPASASHCRRSEPGGVLQLTTTAGACRPMPSLRAVRARPWATPERTSPPASCSGFGGCCSTARMLVLCWSYWPALPPPSFPVSSLPVPVLRSSSMPHTRPNLCGSRLLSPFTDAASAGWGPPPRGVHTPVLACRAACSHHGAGSHAQRYKQN